VGVRLPYAPLVRQAAQVFAAVVEPILVPMVGFEAVIRLTEDQDVHPHIPGLAS
jgi:hypothetical protein